VQNHPQPDRFDFAAVALIEPVQHSRQLSHLDNSQAW
jgi:hypothetical protein